jgi:diguanylate cyclase
MRVPQIITLSPASRTRGVHVAPRERLLHYITSIRDWLPRGHLLSDEAWARRHSAVVKLLWAHVLAVFLFALWTNHDVAHSATEASVLVAAAMASQWGGFGRTMRSAAASFGLISASAMFVHLSGGYIEAHFHFFIMIAVISLYQEWLPFLIAIAYVVIHHALLGIVDPGAVFNNPVAQANPLLWAGIHGAFVLAASLVSLASWRFVEQQSLHDPLTGLPNRALFVDRLDHAMAVAARTGRPLAVMYLDVDEFKKINDTLGHAAGDELLRSISRRLRACLRSGDTPGRLGGDEFAVLLENVAESNAALDVAERIRAAMAEPFELVWPPVDVRLSIGLAVAQVTDTADMIVRGADVAMYAAKRDGGGRVRLFDSTLDWREPVAPVKGAADAA